LWLFSVGVLEGQDVSEKSAHNPRTEDCHPIREWSHFFRNSNLRSQEFCSMPAYSSWYLETSYGKCFSVTNRCSKCVEWAMKVSYNFVQ
jgi:hypothetical protein